MTAAAIRPFEEADVPRIWEIVSTALAPYGLTVSPETTDRDLADIQATYVDAGGCFRVLAKGDRVIGCYGLHNEGDGVVELRKMYLEPTCKGRGFGRMLMEDALTTARKLGFATMVLETNGCLREAVGLYRAYGFEEYARGGLAARCDLAMKRALV
ncbi:MAG: GNAT family N-acetyltransferase [bacterium]|nr:GNAT family N-acetyltransferase [bacterium]